MKNPIKTVIDWYIYNYHSGDYIHREMIQGEIKSRLDQQKKQLDTEYDFKLQTAKQKMRAEYDIKEAGYKATISVLNERDMERTIWHEKVIDVYYRVRGWAQELALITAQNQHHGKEIQSNVAEYIGKLDKIEINADGVIKEIEKKEDKDMKVLEA